MNNFQENFKKEKIILGVLSSGDKYAIDNYGTLFTSGGTAGYCAITLMDGGREIEANMEKLKSWNELLIKFLDFVKKQKSK